MSTLITSFLITHINVVIDVTILNFIDQLQSIIPVTSSDINEDIVVESDRITNTISYGINKGKTKIVLFLSLYKQHQSFIFELSVLSNGIMVASAELAYNIYGKSNYIITSGQNCIKQEFVM